MSKRINKTRFLAVFATTTLIFVAGILIGHSVTSSKVSELQETQNSLRLQAMAFETKYSLIEEELCSAIRSENPNKELYYMSDRLNMMEGRLGKNNPSVLSLVEEYSLLEIRHFLIQQRANKECEENRNLVLFFYSNLGDCDDCDKQGFVLNYIRDKYEDSVYVYSFNINMDNAALNTLKEIYEVETAPTLVINGEKHEGLMDREKIEGEIS